MLETFRQSWAGTTGRREVPSSIVERYAPDVPSELVELWKADGWSGWGDGLLWFTNPDDFTGVMEEWVPLLSEFKLSARPLVFARGAFGHLYLWDSGAVHSFDPVGHLGGYPVTQVTPDFGFFMDELLTMPALKKKILLADRFPDARERLGPLASDECYTFQPIPALGGSVETSTLAKGKLVEYLGILAQAA